ncbi:MAG TPA: hypothetical protein VIX58_01815, partial [Anaerolineae bacterium]
MSTATRSFTREIFSPPRLGLARVLCVLIIAASLSVMLAATPLDWNHTYNDSATRDSIRVFGLEPVGTPFALYTGYLFLLKYAALFVSIIFALVILVRRPDSIFALFVAATLALVPHIYSSDNWIDWWLYPAPWDQILQTMSSVLAFATPFFFSGLLYLFPSGRFEPRWARTVFILIFALFFGMVLFSLVGSSPLSDLPDTGWLVFVFLFVTLCTSGVASLIFRYRRVLTIHERQQTRWVFIGMSAVAVWFALLLLGLDGLSDEPVIILLLIHLKVLIPTLIPLTIGISILRYGLWDMDPLLNRTLVYGMLSAVIVGLYVLVVGGLGSLIHANGSGWLAVLVTGLVAILFAPLRERLQRAVNRLMYGERDDPLTLIEHLGEELRAVVTPEVAMQTIADTLVQTLKLPYAAVELVHPDEAERVASAGSSNSSRRITFPIEYQSGTIGTLVVSPRASNEPLTTSEMRLLKDIAQQAGMVAHVAQITAELKSSRERIVTAREEERRRLRRDLHDELGPTLAGQALKLDAVL